MSTETTTPATASKSSTSRLMIILPYAIAVVAQLPLLMLYFKNLWAKPHYQFFPFAILATVILAWSRWPREKRTPFFSSRWSDFLLFGGLGSGLLGVLFVEPWFTACSVFLLATSFLARTSDSDYERSLWTCALPLFVALALPFGLDQALINKLQNVSANFTSGLLDLVGLGHHMTGVVIKIPGQTPYGIEEACSGVQSFFTLLFFGFVFIVMNRRPFFRATILIAAAVFWAIFVNTLRIFLIPVADVKLGINLVEGVSHEFLGYTVLALGVFLLFSTDQFLVFLFGPVEPTTGQSGPFGRLLTWVWNGLVAGQAVDDDDEDKKKSRRKPITVFSHGLTYVAAGLLLVGGLWGLVDVSRSMSQSSKLSVRFFDADVTMPFEAQDLPDKIENWTLLGSDDPNDTENKKGYFSKNRTQGSDLGQRSDIWQYRAPRCIATASMDQTFPGWHELTTCYKNQGWKLVAGSRKRIEVNMLNGDEPWPYIEAEFVKDTGEHGYLVFSHFDAFGEPFADAPKEWGTLNSFFIRARNRLSHRVRARLFRGEAYQTQVFVATYGSFDDSLKMEITDRYLQIRETLRQRFMEKRNQETGETASLPADPPAQDPGRVAENG